MYTPRKTFENTEEIKRFVKECDEEFEKRLSLAVNTVRQTEGLKLIALSGPTCSGKTTLSKKLVSDFAEYGRTIHVISIDNFYYDRAYLEERSKRLGYRTVDYDSIDTIDFEELRECVSEVFTDDETIVPIYDFKSGKTVGFEHIAYTDGEIFIFEGIQAVYPEISALFRGHPHSSVVIRPTSSICYGDLCFEPDEIRLLRRLVRDYKFRASSPEKTFDMWSGVRKNEEQNIFPYIENCNVKIDSTLPYEINMLKPYLEKILPLVDVKSEHYAKAQSILEKLRDIQGISDAYIGADSLFHEFVG